MDCWLGVDVGGVRKRFDIALVDAQRLLMLQEGVDAGGVMELVGAHRPHIVAIDGPRSCAPAGETTRSCERQLGREVCGIRWTPDDAEVRRNPYYEWVVYGLELFRALERAGATAVEVFPTASWTRWLGPRGTQTRTGWTRRGLQALALDGIPARTNQDQRDAIAAAVTARQHHRGETQIIGQIVVPARTPAG